MGYFVVLSPYIFTVPGPRIYTLTIAYNDMVLHASYNCMLVINDADLTAAVSVDVPCYNSR